MEVATLPIYKGNVRLAPCKHRMRICRRGTAVGRLTICFLDMSFSPTSRQTAATKRQAPMATGEYIIILAVVS